MALIGDTSELDTLLYGGKYMLPEAASYTMTTPWGVVSSDVSGGFVRQQLQFFNSPAQVQVVYRCVTKPRVDFLKSFIRLHEGLPFIAALAVDTDEVEPYVVDVVGAPTWQENGFSGTCTLTYQVQPTPNADYDEFLQWSGSALGDDSSEFANWIAKTANWDLPDAKQMPIYATGTTSAFVSDLYYDNTTSVGFSDLVTFSRLSSGSYIGTDGVLKTAADNEPRFESGGLLVEQQSTNLILKSDGDITSGSNGWTVIATPSNGIDPTGATSRVGWSSSAPSQPYNAFTVTPGESYTFSFFAKSGTLSYARFAVYDATNASFIVPAQNRAVGAAWSRISIPFVTPANCTSVRVYPLRIDSAEQLNVVHYWFGAQCEKQKSASSYIKTDGAAATRAADSASVDMQPHTAGTIFAEFLPDAVAIERVVYTAGGITLKRLSSGAISVTNGAVTVTSAVVPRGSVKAAISYDGATLKLAVNGIVYSAASALPSVGVSIVLGNTTFANVWQRSEAYDNARLVEVTQ